MNEVEASWRAEYGRLFGFLMGQFGTDQLSLIEDVIQDTFAKALIQWPIHGEPKDRGAWLRRVAHNMVVDRIRRERRMEPLPETEFQAEETGDGLDEARLIILCSHPALTRESQIALTLKVACGFSTQEIARALLSNPAAIEQRLVRAKATLRREGISFELPANLAGPVRDALRVAYLIFSEGHFATSGDDPIRVELCYGAVMLAERLARLSSEVDPEIHALMALMLLTMSRFPARVESELLEDQDRSLWDAQLIARGMRHLERALEGPLTRFHVEAVIASAHARAATFSDTDWLFIVEQYDLLVSSQPDPVVRLNRAIALTYAGRHAEAFESLSELEGSGRLSSYAPLKAAMGMVLARLGRSQEARERYEEAARMAHSTREAELYRSRANDLGREDPGAVGPRNLSATDLR